ncbi:MAG: efflux RND transporter periplasmic adaptor subunit [Planctomycetota bacterium]
MCRQHGVPEALCAKCRPFLKGAFQIEGDWCKEHDLPESQCAICNPDKVKAQAAETPAPTQPAPPPTPQRNGTARRAALPPSPTCTKSKSLVRLQSPEIARTAGLQFVSIEERPLTATINRNAELTYDANRYARLSPRAAGVIVDVRRDLGDSVVAGDVLAVVDSAELGAAKADLLQIVAGTRFWTRSAERQHSLADRGIGTEGEALEAENRLAETQIHLARSRQRLGNLGLSGADVESVEQSQDASSSLQVTAPFEGLVIERTAVLGEVVERTNVLFAVANTSSMWAMIDLFESDVPVVVPGQDVIFALESVPGESFAGTITWVSTQLSPSTRTLKARADVTNVGGLLRANSFGRVQIVIRRSDRSLFVPKDAVQWDGCCNIVFVRANDEGTAFQPLKVRLGIDTGAAYEVLSGVQGGDIVVTSGSYLLKTEILKGSIGAGCCDVVEKLTK